MRFILWILRCVSDLSIFFVGIFAGIAYINETSLSFEDGMIVCGLIFIMFNQHLLDAFIYDLLYEYEEILDERVV